MPVSFCSFPTAAPDVSSILIELAFDQAGERLDSCRGVAPGRADFDDGPRRRGEHHQPHDRAPRHRSPVLAYLNIRVELPGGLDEARGGARMEPLLIADRAGEPHRRQGLRGGAGRLFGVAVRAHRRASARSCEATLMYLRPASWAPSAARSSASVWRRLASLISIGRLTPAMTSILPRSITEIARFEGVPPNMSVSSTAPSPLSTSAIERRISWRRRSMSSSGPMHTAAIWACGPTTCSRAAANSAASRP